MVVGEQGPGELRVRGPNLFREYWGRPEATASCFDEEGWFKTGDIVKLEGEPPYYRILGRSSMDIIKSGGHKISALDIENELLAHPGVHECAVLGLPDEALGERVAVLVACREGHQLTAVDVETWVRDRRPPYEVPRAIKFVDSIPRNAMGKVNKTDLVKRMFYDACHDHDEEQVKATGSRG